MNKITIRYNAITPFKKKGDIKEGKKKCIYTSCMDEYEVAKQGSIYKKRWFDNVHHYMSTKQ